MRITQELKNRIERELSSKYSDLKADVQTKFEYEILTAKEEKAKRLQMLYETEPVILALYKVRSYRDEELDAEYFVEHNERQFFPVEYEAKEKALNSLRKQEKLDYEELAINISYEKDLDGIRKAFEKLGLTF